MYTPDEILREQVRSLGSLEVTLKNRAKIFIPPIPRFVFGSCCDNSTHGNNIRTPLHPQHALAEHTRQRHTIIKTLNSTGITTHRVLDVIQSINKAQDTPFNRTSSLKQRMHKDNNNLTLDGYRLLADSIIATASTMTSRPAVTQGPPRGIEIIYWHGFTTTTRYGSRSRASPGYSYRVGVGVTTPTNSEMLASWLPTCN